ncbi:MAG: FAD-dependent monooxygenase, partial [Leptolyngbya sp.]|nr:FAD-dependent monooxygenase [Candidatus Melainabacteria bacterium]
MTESMQPVDTDVLIVGAGPTGLILSVELLRRGITCRVVDKLSGPSTTSRAIGIHARTLELFEQMDIVEPFLESGWKSHAFQVYNKDKQIVRMTFGELETKYPYELCLIQPETERILSEVLSTKGGAIEWNTELLSFTQSLEGVTARVQKAGEGESAISCKWLVGCDGAHSLVRKLLDIGFPGTPYCEQYVLADIDFETTLDPSEHYLFSNEEGVVGFHPFSSEKARMFAELGRIKHSRKISDSMPADRVQFAEPNLEELQAILDRRGPGKVK